MKIHVYPRHLPQQGTEVVHVVATGLTPKDTKAAMRRILDKHQWSEAWYMHAKRRVEGLGQLFKIEMLLRSF